MKKAIITILALGSFIVWAGLANAAETPKKLTKEEARKIAAEERKAKEEAETKTQARAKKKELEAKNKEMLAQHEWAVYTALSGKKGKLEEDTLTFAPEGKVVSKRFSAKGYNQSNYTLTIEDNGNIIWETMQTNEGVGVLFWRGELLPNGIMQGIMSLQPQKGANEDYIFTTVKPEDQAKVEPKKEEKKAEVKKEEKKKGKK